MLPIVITKPPTKDNTIPVYAVRSMRGAEVVSSAIFTTLDAAQAAAQRIAARGYLKPVAITIRYCAGCI